jgi:hypothetical protein
MLIDPRLDLKHAAAACSFVIMAEPSVAYLDRSKDPSPLLHHVEDRFTFEPEKLLGFFEEHVRPLPMGRDGDDAEVGTWAVRSCDDRHDGGTARDRQGIQPGEDGRLRPTATWAHPPYRTPTNLYFGYVRELIEQIERRLFVPARTRFMFLPPGSGYAWHRDAATEKWRMHIPVITNGQSKFMWRPWGPDDEIVKLHMPIGPHPYWARIDVEHRFRNKGATARVHLVLSSGEPGRPF